MADQISRNRFALSASAATSAHTDGLVILHVPSGRIFTSNQTGACIFRCLEERLPLEGIAAEIARVFGIDQATALKDTARFLAELGRNGLTERVGE
jgi:hypothetical protein